MSPSHFAVLPNLQRMEMIEVNIKSGVSLLYFYPRYLYPEGNFKYVVCHEASIFSQNSSHQMYHLSNIFISMYYEYVLIRRTLNSVYTIIIRVSVKKQTI